MNVPFIAALIASLLELFGSWNYIRDTRKGITRPHIYSWLLWTVLAFIGGAIQFSQGSWTCAVAFGASCAMNGAVFVLGLRQKGSRDITKSDQFALSAALLIMPVWLATKSALLASGLLSIINLFSSFPTFRKAWVAPEEENLNAFIVYTLVTSIQLFAVSPLTLVTAFYPIVVVLLNGGVAALLFYRRRALSLSALR